jgi:hypothetical protein
MGLINWNKPRRKSDPESHAEDNIFDGGPPGAYVPNMNDDDKYSWKGKMVGTRSGHPHVEIRYYPFLIIVSLKGGYKYKFYTREKTKDYNIHVSTSGAIQLSFEKWEEFKAVVDEAKETLRRWHEQHDQP